MSFNMVNAMSQGSQTGSFLYGPEHQRVKQVAAYNGQNITTWYLSGVGGGDFELEKNTTTTTIQAKHYIAGKVLHIEHGTSATPASVQTKYLHKDHLGSIALITNSTGATNRDQKVKFSVVGNSRAAHWAVELSNKSAHKGALSVMDGQRPDPSSCIFPSITI
jgi:hypothetical protein